MGKKSKCGQYIGDHYWQSPAMGSTMWSTFVDQMVKIAVNRYKWLNLPPTCDARFLEMTLLYDTQATFSIDPMTNHLFTLKATQRSQPGIYDVPEKWESYGHGHTIAYDTDSSTGVMVYDSATRYPLMQKIYMWAHELTDIMRTKQINRFHQKIPLILSGPAEMQNQMVNIFKQVSGGEPGIVTTKAIDLVDFKSISLDIEYLGIKLQEDYANTWADIYRSMGVKSATVKSERMVEGEVFAQNEPTSLAALDGLEQRRRACEVLNRDFSKYLVNGPIWCVWNKDVDTSNYYDMVSTTSDTDQNAATDARQDNEDRNGDVM